MGKQQRTHGEGQRGLPERGRGRSSFYTHISILSFHIRFCLKRGLHLKMGLKTPNLKHVGVCEGAGHADACMCARVCVILSLGRLRALLGGRARGSTATRTPAVPLTSAGTLGKRPIFSEP